MALTEEQKRIALELAVQGKTMKEIREAVGVSTTEFYRLKQLDIPFATEISRARAEGLEDTADSLLNITDEEQDVQKARLKSDNIKFILSKRKPEVYGDRLDLNINQTVDIGGALADARSRLLPSHKAEQIKDVQPIDLITVNDGTHPDAKPVVSTEVQHVLPKSIDDLID